MSNGPVNPRDAYLGLGAWLGAILERLRRGQPAIPGGTSDDAAEADAESFRAVGQYRVTEWHVGPVERSPALDHLLNEINRLTKGKGGEEELWDAICGYLPNPIDPKLALDLIDRGIGLVWLSHRWQEEVVWWRLVDIEPEAVQNLAITRYTNPADDWSRVEEVLYQFDWPEFLTVLAQCQPSSQDKARRLAAWISARPDAMSIIKTRRVRHAMFNTAWDELTGEKT